MDKKINRKHWSDYGGEEIGYGHHPVGFGPYHMHKDEYWLDEECAMDHEKEIYAKYLKSKGYKE